MPKQSATVAEAAHQRQRVLTQAVVNAAEIMGLRHLLFAEALGVSEAFLLRMKKGHALIKEKSKEEELATYVIRVYQNLTTLMGDDKAAIRSWMNTQNDHLHGRPEELIQQVQGLIQVLGYLEAMRGKV